MILKTDFRESGAGNLVDYIQRDRSEDAVETVDIQNQSGRQLSDGEVERFVEKSQEFQFQRHMIVSPDPKGQYTPAEVSANTRETMNHEFGQRPTTEYVYAVHRDTEFPHAHVAVTGRQSELEMDRAEINRLRERASTVYREPDRVKEATADTDSSRSLSQAVTEETRNELHERELELEEHPEKDVLRNTERAKGTSPATAESEGERDIDRAEQRQPESEATREGDSTPEPECDRELKPETSSDRDLKPEPERDMDRTIGG